MAERDLTDNENSGDRLLDCALCGASGALMTILAAIGARLLDLI